MYTYKKVNNKEITDEIFKQVMVLENSTGSGYHEEQMKSMWNVNSINDNFVCYDKDKIVATLTYNPNSKRRNGSVYMVNITVMPEYRRKGIAQNLILTGTKYYLNKGETKVASLQVDEDNTPAIHLYQKVGYKIVGPICLADEDDEQYIMESTFENILNTINSFNKGLENN